MKKIILIFLVFFITLNLSAKIGLVSGKIDFNNTHTTKLYDNNFTDNDNMGITIKPSIGFYKDDITLGGGVGYTYNKVNDVITDGYSVMIFVEKSYQIVDNLTYDTNVSIEVGIYGERNYASFNISPTFTYELSKHWGVTIEIAKLGYYFSNDKETTRNDVYDSNLYFNTNITSLSISYYF